MEMGKTLPFFAIPPVGMKECSVTPLLENAGVLTKWATRNQELVSGVTNNIAMRQVGWVIYVVHITYPNHEFFHTLMNKFQLIILFLRLRIEMYRGISRFSINPLFKTTRSSEY